MVAKKDETAPETVDEPQDVTEVAPKVEKAAEQATEAPAAIQEATWNGPEVVGAITDPSQFVAEPANICLECGSVWPIDKGVTCCPACTGKTVSGFRHQRASIVDADNARFTGKTAVDPNAKKDE